jgi:NTE family protein
MSIFKKILEKTFGKKIGIALGGGAARGQAHIGVLKAFEEEGVPIDFIAGTSVGSLIGALYCAGYDWKDIQVLSRQIKWGDLVSFGLPRKGFMNPDKMEKLLTKLIYGKEFKDMQVPFAAVAVDLNSGEEIVFDGGPVAPAVRASCSIPGIFTPARIDDKYYIDGGIVNSVPSDVVRSMGADFVIGVDLNSDRIQEGEPKHLLDVLYYTFQILVKNNVQRGINDSDVIIAPDLTGYSYRNMNCLDELIKLGEDAARAILPQIKKELGWRRRTTDVGKTA